MDVRRIALRALGVAWLLAWGIVLLALHAPWRSLGGIVPERVRWLERVVLFAGAAAGFEVGGLLRDLALRVRRSHAAWMRRLAIPPAAAAAVALVALAVRGADPAIGIVTIGLCSWWAGLDAALGALPLARGEPYAPWRPIEPPRAAEDDGDGPD